MKRSECPKQLAPTPNQKRRRRVRFGFALLALGVLWSVQRAPASAQEAPLPCAGDCDNLGSVTIDELVTGINIALGNLALDRCPLFDVDLNGAVTVDEILTGVDNALNGCPSGEVSFDKVSLAILPGGQEEVKVTANDKNGHTLGWTVASSAPNIVTAVKTGDKIELTGGQSPGSAVITVTTQPGPRPLHRRLPVRVYDPMVLDVGGLLIKYVDTFQCIPANPEHPEWAESFYRPVVPEGWYALGSFRMDETGCPSTDGKPNINGQQWMMIVKEAQAESALVTSFDESISGDLPTGYLSDPPRTLEFTVGDNEVRGSVLSEGDWSDSFSFTLKTGEYLNSVVLKDFAGSPGDEIRFFTGTVATDDSSPAFLGYAPMGTDQIGANYLAPGGLHPLEPGVYTISIASYSVDASAQPYQLVLNIGTQLIRPALAAPHHFQNQAGYWGRVLWAPVCPEGYVGMGTVVTTDDSGGVGPNTPPAKGEGMCVRSDLTKLGAPLTVKPEYKHTFSTARIEAPVNSDYGATKVYLETGTMSVVFPEDWTDPYPVNRVLAVELPLLIDTPYQNWRPSLVGPYDPPEYSEPVLAKAVLVPFTAILNGTEFATRRVGWMVENSPFVRVERVQTWKRWKSSSNASTTVQSLHYSTETGTDTNTSNTYSGEVGISVTGEGGVEFLGTGGKISATVSGKFGYSHQTSTTELTHHTVTVDLNVAPCTYLCVWGLQSTFVVKMFNDDTGQLDNILPPWEMSDYAESSVTYAFADYPLHGSPPSCP